MCVRVGQKFAKRCTWQFQKEHYVPIIVYCFVRFTERIRAAKQLFSD